MDNNVNSKLVGQFLISIGTVSILGFVFLLTFFVGYFNDISSILFFGPLNDVTGALEAILTAILAAAILALQGRRWLWLNGIGVVLSWIGAFIVTLDSLMAGGFLSKSTVAVLRIVYGFPSLLTIHDLHFGFGLIGIWLIILNIQAFQAKSWPAHLMGLGFAVGIFMTIGLIGSLAALGFVFLYPIWCICLGRWMLSGKR